MENDEFGIIIVVGLIITTVVIPFLNNLWNSITKFFSNVYFFLYGFALNQITIIVFFKLLIESLIVLSYIKIKNSKKRKKWRKSEEEKELTKLTDFLKLKLNDLEYEDLKKIYYEFKNLKFSFISIFEYEDKINIKLLKIEKKLIELKHEEKLDSINEKLEESNKELERINHEIYIKERKEEEKKNKILRRLTEGTDEVFKRENLTAKEIELLKEEGYVSVKEYCVLENKIISVLVKPIMNHSPTHTFLVWSVVKLLKKFPEIERIIDHETRDADITFKIKNKNYAVEVEKGSLLRKKVQLREKIDYLNETYRDKWLILVSNKNLIKHYKEFGPVSTRKDIRKNIEKWVENSKKRR